uniref:Zona pellucida glycoprotein 3c n=1 Tax=Fundulus heteroclitus TaxID=8078 RepID=A0A3Q2Q399_FUNHE
MVSSPVGLVLLLFCFSCSFALSNLSESEQEKERIVTPEKGEDEKQASLPEAQLLRASADDSSREASKKLPEYLTVPVSRDHKDDLKPARGASKIPSWLQKVLLGIPPTLSSGDGARNKPELVEVRCHLDRILVRIRKEVFSSRDAYKHLSLGSCPVNEADKDYYYLLHSLKTDCGFEVQSWADYLSISVFLHYKPSGPVLREMPFDIPLECKYYRLFYSYKVGFHPKLQGGTVYKVLHPNSSFTISPLDASGNKIHGRKVYNLGDPMHFEASGHDEASPEEKRMYIKKCFVTVSQDPYSHPRYTVINNQGCMIDSKKSGQSKFLSGDSKMVQKFSMGAFVFQESAATASEQQFYLHCEMNVGPSTPTPSRKACNYDHGAGKWKELYGNDCVCNCCDSTCPPAELEEAPKEIVSSRSWKVDRESKVGSDKAGRLLRSPETATGEEPSMKKQTYFQDCDED